MTIRRRDLLAGLAGISLPSLTLKAGPAPSNSLKLGVASYSLRKFSRQQAIPMLQELGVRYVNIKEFHMRYSDPPEELKRARAEFDAAGLEVVSGGVVVTYREEDSNLRKYFDYARICRLPMLVMMPTARQLPQIEKLALEYGIRVALHNHGPEDKNFPTPESAYEAITNLDSRIGICIDVGHSARARVDVVQSIEKYASRLIDLHIKDLTDLDHHSDCVVGRGVLPIADILRTLAKLRYQDNVALEYEAEPEDPMPGMRASFAYLRGIVAGLRDRG